MTGICMTIRITSKAWVSKMPACVAPARNKPGRVACVSDD